MKNSNDTIWDRISDLPIYSTALCYRGPRLIVISCAIRTLISRSIVCCDNHMLCVIRKRLRMLQSSALVPVGLTSTMLFIAVLNGEKATKKIGACIFPVCVLNDYFNKKNNYEYCYKPANLWLFSE